MTHDKLGAPAWTGEHTVLTGSCSWTDKTLVDDADWYPGKTMSAEERLRYYASQFPLTEIDSTYYAPPAERQVALWAERVPDGFRFDVKAFSLLTGHPTRPRSLWRDLRDALPPDVVEKRNIYPKHLSPEALDEAWRRFEAALRPLHEAGRLGAVLFQYPPWFGPRRENRAEIEALRSRLPDYRISVEFRSPRWLAEERDRERTLAMLEEHGLVFVSLDAPPVSGLPRVMAVTNPELFIMRFHGRSDSTWNDTSRSAAERFRYLYSERELEELVPAITEHAAEATETHMLMNNCYRDYSVRNAATLRDLLAAHSG
ncbi:MAG: DUF72 domain-containing protein [Solirubrobacterales bacterium]|nr:DUF72 domain-containing protein [Solirubrobacterales bacterium]MBV9682800.1 DUF72 domain-containing protein [Solirubrobacterales bacterium]MBV9806236.1 DUF72 domain-containing protein [Solirubrobacterales bacterium]